MWATLTKKMQDSGIEWIGEIPLEWEIRSVGNFFTQLKKKNVNLEEKNLLSLSYGKVIKKDINTSDGLLPKSFNSYNIVSKDDIVLRMTDLQNDKRSLRTGIVKESRIITSAYINLRNKNSQMINSKYVYYLLHAFDINKGFYGMGSGVRQNVNYNDIKNLSIIYPSKSIQEKIINEIEKKSLYINKVIEKSSESIEELKKYKQSLITEVVTKGLNDNVEMKDSGLEWIGNIPKVWNVKPLKYLVEERKEQLKNTTNTEYTFTYVDISSVSFEKGIERYEKLSFKEAPSRARKIVHKNDIIISTVRTYLRSIVRIEHDHNFIVSTGFSVLIPLNKSNPEYIEYLLK